MAKIHISSTNATDKTIRAIDRKRERERQFILNKASENAESFSIKLVQRLIDRDVIEANSVQSLQTVFADRLRLLATMDEFDIQMMP